MNIIKTQKKYSTNWVNLIPQSKDRDDLNMANPCKGQKQNSSKLSFIDRPLSTKVFQVTRINIERR